MSSIEDVFDVTNSQKVDTNKVYIVKAFRIFTPNSTNDNNKKTSNSNSNSTSNSNGRVTRSRNRNGGSEKEEVEVELSYTNCTIVGTGSFGVVVKADLIAGGSGAVALKRTKQDRRFKNRELQIMKVLKHGNIVKLLYYFHEAVTNQLNDEVYLNLVLDFIPQTIYRSYRDYIKRRQNYPEFLIKLYMYQLARAVNYIHSMGICHRDLKPHNILVDPETGIMTLIDFGSAKVLKEGEANVSYTCSRYYRAPELIFGSTTYSLSIDEWSMGCVMGELLKGSILFPGNSGIDQLVEIIKVLGTPTREEIEAMNPTYIEHQFPHIKAVHLSKIFPRHCSPEAIDLLSKLLIFNPSERISAIDMMVHPFFDQLREEGMGLLNGGKLPDLFNFSRRELSVAPDLIKSLVPLHAEQQLWESEEKIDINRFEPILLVPVRLD